ncbi:hypothetical protein DFH09DRAFT_1328277 [Mycena vulgaris]|nr:hypothetical protein DFH09DRAFT_1328277 [Mycena vulgaris]
MPSPFAPKIGTNYCPKEQEIIEITALLVQPTLRLERLQNEITEMQKAIDELKTERDSLAGYVRAHQALISPVRRLPPDILTEIFLACIPTHRNCVMSAREAPVILGRICSSWRATSLSAPRLWARLHVVEPTRPHYLTSILFEEKLAQRLETTKTWLSRSGQCPLSLSFESGLEYGFSSADSTTRPHAASFLQALIKFAPRWQHIQFTIPLSALEILSHLSEADVPMLKSVAFYHNPHHAHHSPTWGPFEMLHASQISSFSISGMYFNGEPPLRWNQLTILCVTTLTTSKMIFETISRCPELRNCKLMAHDGPGAEICSSHPVIQLSFLYSFELHCVGSMTTSKYLLPRLSAPELEDFILIRSPDLHGPIETEASAPLAHFLAASMHLERLRIDTCTFSKSSLLEILRSLPHTIQRLELDASNKRRVAIIPSLDDEVLSVLTPASGFSPFCCPVLQELVIHHCYGISDAALLQFIAVRMHGGVPTTLNRVTIQFDREMQLDILPSLRPFITTGRDVSITYLQVIPPQFSPWQGLADAPRASMPGMPRLMDAQ